MTLAEHEIEVKKLNVLESQLMQRICLIDDNELCELYLRWTKQRNVCNEGFISMIKKDLDPAPTKK